jgi:hypothetical protein
VRKVDKSPPSTAKLKKQWSYTTAPFMSWTGKILPFTVFLVLVVSALNSELPRLQQIRSWKVESGKRDAISPNYRFC